MLEAMRTTMRSRRAWAVTGSAITSRSRRSSRRGPPGARIETQYGAGTMTIWDHGTFEQHLWDDKKVEITFHGERLTGRYGLFPIGRPDRPAPRRTG